MKRLLILLALIISAANSFAQKQPTYINAYWYQYMKYLGSDSPASYKPINAATFVPPNLSYRWLGYDTDSGFVFHNGLKWLAFMNRANAFGMQPISSITGLSDSLNKNLQQITHIGNQTNRQIIANGFNSNGYSIKSKTESKYTKNDSVATTKFVNYFTYFLNTVDSSMYTPFGSGLYSFGNSITYGQNASPLDSGYAYKVSAYIGGSFTNYGYPSYRCRDVIDTINKINFDGHRTRYTTLLIGTNDAFFNRTQRLINCVNGDIQTIIANAFSDTAILSSSMTMSGSFSDWIGLTKNGRTNGKATSTYGDNISFSYTGTNAYLIFFVNSHDYDTFSDSIEIQVDGLRYAILSTDAITVPSEYDFKPVIIKGLPYGTHTIKAINRREGGLMIVDFGGRLMKPANSVPMSVLGILHRSPGSGITDSWCDSINAVIRDTAVGIFKSAGYPINYIPNPSTWQPIIMTTDGTHPNNLGHSVISNWVESYIKLQPGMSYANGIYWDSINKRMGINNNPSKTFEVNGDSRFDGLAGYDQDYSGSYNAYSFITKNDYVNGFSGMKYIPYQGTPGGKTIYGGSANGENYLINSTSAVTAGKVILDSLLFIDKKNSRVGIGTSAPSTSLELSQSIPVFKISGVSSAEIIYGTNSQNIFKPYLNVGQKKYIIENTYKAKNAFAIDSFNRVGIGTITPVWGIEFNASMGGRIDSFPIASLTDSVLTINPINGQFRKISPSRMTFWKDMGSGILQNSASFSQVNVPSASFNASQVTLPGATFQPTQIMANIGATGALLLMDNTSGTALAGDNLILSSNNKGQIFINDNLQTATTSDTLLLWEGFFNKRLKKLGVDQLFSRPHYVKVYQLIQQATGITCTVGAGAGTGATCSITGGDAGGEITVNTGTIPTAGATVVTITYGGNAYSTTSFPVITPGESNAASLTGATGVYTTGNTTSFTITTASGAISGATTYKWKFHVTGQ